MATYTDNYNLIKPTYAEVADIVPLNNNFEKIDEVMHSSQISLAPAYDQTKEYAAGDTVMYELLMYKCTAPTTGVWDPSKWERTTASESGGGGSAELDILGEASGAVASFADGASAGLAKCIAEMVPKQAGSGTPSPDNVRPISGSTSVTVTISDGETSTTKTTALGQTVYGGRLNVLTGELTIDRAIITITSESQFTTFSADSTYGSLVTIASDGKADNSNIMSISDMALGISNNDRVSPDYVSLDRCYIDDNGRVRLRASKDVTISTKADMLTRFLNAQVVYILATPQTVQLTPQEVNSLLGQNNISADTGDVDIVYVKASAPIQPNPTGTPTATLSKLGIEGTVFEVPNGGGGSSGGINYSTTEQVVGTWEDENGIEKPLYQKSYNLANPINGTFDTLDSIEDVIKISGTFKRTSTNIWYEIDGRTESTAFNQYYVRVQINDSNNVLLDYAGYTQSDINRIKCTVQYTKITD